MVVQPLDVAQQVEGQRLPRVVLSQLGEMSANRVGLPATKLALLLGQRPRCATRTSVPRSAPIIAPLPCIRDCSRQPVSPIV